MRTRAWLAAVAASTLAACAAPSPTGGDAAIAAGKPADRSNLAIQSLSKGRYEPSPVALGDSRDLGRIRARNDNGLVSSAPLDAYLMRIRVRLLAASGVAEVPGAMYLAANPTLNAEATPDGNVIIDLAWLTTAKSEDEIAAIIGHELSHVLLRHHTSDGVKKLQQQTRINASMAAADRAKLMKRPNSASRDAKVVGQLEAAGAFLDWVALPTYQRGQELDADRLGTDLLVAAGYNPIAMQTVLDRLAAQEAGKPPADVKVADVKALAASAGVKKAATPTAQPKDLKEALRSALQETAFIAAADLASATKSDHPSAAMRTQLITDYIARNYEPQTERPQQTASLVALLADPVAGKVIANYQAAFEAERRFARNEYAAAYAAARTASQVPTAMDPYPNWLLFQAASATGRKAEADAALKRVDASQQVPVKVYRRTIEVTEQRGDYAGATVILTRASADLGDPMLFAPAQARLLRKQGKRSEAEAVAFRCLQETPELKDYCKQ